MNRQLSAIIAREGNGYIAMCPEVGIASQRDTVARARDDLAEALALFFEAASPGKSADACEGKSM